MALRTWGSGGWELEEAGDSGRRARAFFLERGVVIEATDANVARYAIAVVLEAMQKTGHDKGFDRLLRLSKQLLKRFPDDQGELVEETMGEVGVDFNKAGIGYGYIRPAGQGHECGGGLFDTDTHVVTLFETQTVYLFDDSVKH